MPGIPELHSHNSQLKCQVATLALMVSFASSEPGVTVAIREGLSHDH